MSDSGETVSSRDTHNLNNSIGRRRRRGLDIKDMTSVCPSPAQFLDAGGEFTNAKKRGNCDSGWLDKGKRAVKPVGIEMVSIEEADIGDMNCVSHGSISVIGRRRSMKDALMSVVPLVVGGGGVDSYDFFAVYDGHGGAKVAHVCRDMMHQLVAEEVEKGNHGGGDEKGKIYWEKVMGTCFRKMDEEVSRLEKVENDDGEEEGEFSEGTVGSSALVVLVGKEEVVVANCGDSRAVLCREGVAMPLSTEHKPDRPDERERVEAAGGQIINRNDSRVLGVLSTSRSIGDQYLKPYVTSEPEVTVTKREEGDEFIVMATDGLWDVISNEFACELVKNWFSGVLSKKLNGSCAAEAAAMLVELAMARGSKDNISIILVELKSSK